MQVDPLRTAELLAIIAEATTPVGHDVRNRIASVRNLAFFVRRKLAAEENRERDPRVNDFLLRIENEVQRTDEVIEVWTDRVQGVRQPGVEAIRVASSLRLAIECARLPPARTVTCEIADETWLVQGDPHTLAVAVRCLLENSAEADAPEIRLSLSRERDDCVICVSDTGRGIAEPEKCLEPFASTKPGHLGLGLGVARRIAARLGGALIIGRPASGAEVILRLPLVAEP